MTTRVAYKKTDYEQSNQDLRLDQSIAEIKLKCPEAWEMILSYVRSLSIPFETANYDPNAVTAEYHKRAYLVKVIRRLDGFEAI